MTTTMTPNTIDIARTPVPTAQAAKPIWRVGASAGLIAAVATTAVAVVAKAVDVPMLAAPKTEEVGRAIPVSGYAISTLMCTAIGVLIALALARWVRRPAQVFVVVTTVLTIVSFLGPITTGHATTATRVVLSLTHVVAAAIVVPALASCLSRRPVRHSA